MASNVKIGTAVIDLTLGTSQLIIDLEKSGGRLVDFGNRGGAAIRPLKEEIDRLNAKLKELEATGGRSGKAIGDGFSHSIPPIAAASASLRLLENGLSGNLRAAERLISILPGAGALMTAAFPIAGAAALGGVIIKTTAEITEFFQKIEGNKSKLVISFGDAATEVRLLNDGLRVGNIELENQIAKLSGKPGNGLSLALGEAIKLSDQLTSSLGKNLDAAFNLLKEQGVGRVFGFVTGQKQTQDTQESLGGKTGSTEQVLALKTIRHDAQLEIDRIKNDKNLTDQQKLIELDKSTKDAADKEKAVWDGIFNRAKFEYAKDVKEVTEAKEAVRKAAMGGGPTGLEIGEWLISGKVPARKDLTPAQVDELYKQQKSPLFQNYQDVDAHQSAQLGLMDLAGQKREQADMLYAQYKLAPKAKALETGAQNSKQELPLQHALDTLDAKIRGLNEELKSVGGTEEQKDLAKAFAATAEEVAKVNREQDHLLMGALTAAETQQIASREIIAAKTQEGIAFGKRVFDEIEHTRDLAAAQQFLTKAIGEGYEEQKSAQAESLVYKTLGSERYQNLIGPAPTIENVTSADRVRDSARGDIEAKNVDGSARQSDMLDRQITQERALTAANLQGAGAVRAQVEAEKELEVIRTRGLAGLDDLEKLQELFTVSELKNSSARANSLAIETSNAQKMADAYLHGADAVRAAELQIQIEQIKRNTRPGDDPTPEIKAATDQSAAKYQEQIAQGAGKMVTTYADQAATLERQRAAIEQIVVTDQNRLSIEIALKDVFAAQNKLLHDQVLAVGSAADGMKQYLRDVGNDSESMASAVDSSMKKGVDSVNDQLSRLMTGQKTSWSKMLIGIGQDLDKLALRMGEKALVQAFMNRRVAGTINPADKNSSAIPEGTGAGEATPWDPYGGIHSAPNAPLAMPPALASGFGLRDGQSDATAWFVTLSTGANSPKSVGGGMPQALGMGAGLGASAGLLGGLLGGGGAAAGDGLTEAISMSTSFGIPGDMSALLAAIPMFADGGYPDIGMPSIVGEKGPEMFIPNSAGRVVPAGKWGASGGGGGDTHNYNIDARGTDPVQTERRVAAAIAASHQSAVQKSQIAARENARRRP